VVFLRDRIKGTTERIGHPQPTWEPRNAGRPTVSDDGRYVAFMSKVEEPGSQYGTENPVHLWDLRRGTTVLVTPDRTGGTASATVFPGGIADSAHRRVRTSPEVIDRILRRT
jgi:hypothetical protein